MRFLGWLIILPLLLVLITFSLENKQAVTLVFWVLDIKVTLPLSFLILATLLLGFVMGSFTGWISTLALHMEIRRLKKESRLLGDELSKRPPAPEAPKTKRFALPFFLKPGVKP